MSDLHALIGVPSPTGAFPTLDQLTRFTFDLAAAHPDTVRLRTLGASESGEPIHELTIGTSERHVVVVGNPHPNEPIGLLTIQHLAARLADQPELVAELDVTWHFIPCIDPDGTRLNEGWYAGPLTREHVGRNFYRTPKSKQAEWTFPVQWRGQTIGEPVAGTRVLMSVIDETRPVLFTSLHNADFGGGFFYVTGGDQEYWSGLTGLLEEAGVPVEGGLADTPGAETFAEGVFEQGAVQDYFDLVAEGNPEAVAGFDGGSPSDYASRYGTAALISELPLWTDPRASDPTPGTWQFADLVAATAAKYRADSELILSVIGRLEGELPTHDPLYLALVEALPGNAVIFDAMTEAAASVDRLATNAEEFMELHGLPEMMRLRNGGMLTRLLDRVWAEGASASVGEERENFRAVFDAWCAEIERERPGIALPLDRLVWVQTGAILLAVTRLRDGLPI